MNEAMGGRGGYLSLLSAGGLFRTASPSIPASASAGGGALTHIPIPLSIAGATTGVMQQFGPLFGAHGFSPVANGSACRPFDVVRGRPRGY